MPWGARRINYKGCEAIGGPAALTLSKWSGWYPGDRGESRSHRIEQVQNQTPLGGHPTEAAASGGIMPQPGNLSPGCPKPRGEP